MTVMSITENILYYSTNTYLSYWLGKNFYKQFFVWCSPVFDPSKLSEYHELKKIPPSSSPFSIYNIFHNDVSSGDLHSAKIQENKAGLIRGASLHLERKTISEQEYARIMSIIDKALINDFHPLVYVIPKLKVQDKVKVVEVEKTANPLSIEFQIHDLQDDEFDVIELRGQQ